MESEAYVVVVVVVVGQKGQVDLFLAADRGNGGEVGSPEELSKQGEV